MEPKGRDGGQTRIIIISIYVFVAVACEALLGPLHLDSRAWMYMRSGESSHRFAFLAGYISPIAFLVASVMLAKKWRLGYLVGLIASLMAWPIFFYREFSLYRISNSWLVFNLHPDWRQDYLQPHTNVAAILLLMLATLITVTRLLPSSLNYRNSRMSELNWPAVVLTAVVVCTWYLTSVSPYRMPGFISPGMGPTVSITHVERRGFRFHDTRTAVMRDCSAYISSTDRRLFQYRIQSKEKKVRVSHETCETIFSLLSSPDARLPYTYFVPPNEWNYDYWLVSYEGGKPLQFATLDQSTLPTQLIPMLEEVAKGEVVYTSSSIQYDICFDFCYTPIH